MNWSTIVRSRTICEHCNQEVTELHTLTQCCTACTAEMSLRQINKYARRFDESHKWPVSGRFNVTERAIRRLRHQRQLGAVIPDGGLEYAEALDNEIGRIVNDPAL